MWSIARCGRQLGKVGTHERRRLQAGALVQQFHFRPVGSAVEVAHQHRVRMVVQQLGDEGQLRAPRLRAQRQMRDRDRQALVAVAEPRHQHAAAGDAAGQGDGR